MLSSAIINLLVAESYFKILPFATSVVLTSDNALILVAFILVSNVVGKSAVANFVAIEFVTVVEKFASSPNAAANSFSVSSVAGALSTIDAVMFVAVS